MKSPRFHWITTCLFILNGLAIEAYATHANKPMNLNPLQAPLAIPAVPAQTSPSTSKAKSSGPGASFGYGGKSVDGSAIEKPDTSSGTMNADIPMNPPAPGSSDPRMTPINNGANGAPESDPASAGGGSDRSLASSGPNSYYGNMDLVKDIKGFSDKADLKTGVAEQFLDPRTRRPVSAAEIQGGKRVLMVTPNGNTISGTFDVSGGQNLARTANNVKDPRFSYTQLFGASQSFVEGRVFGFKPDQPTSERAVGMKASQMDYYAADAATIAQMKGAQGINTRIGLYALKYNPGDGSFDIIGGGGGPAANGADGKKLNLKDAGKNTGVAPK